MNHPATTSGADLRLRLSSYLTLALACLCLGYAEQPFLEGILFWLIPLLGVVVIAFVAEGRWLLPIWAANVLACVIFSAVGLWIIISLQQADEVWLESGLGPAILLPYLGPFLMVLLAVKLFRPKRVGDFWQLHGIGVMQVGLGAVLASNPLFVPFLFAYLACAVWCLTQFQLEYGHTLVREVGGPRAAAGSARAVSPGQAGRWVVASMGLTALLFLATPRASKYRWNPLRLTPSTPFANREIQTGFSESIDLNNTGRIEVNDELVFDVLAQEKDGSPKLDLSEGQRWRAGVLDRYQNGKWHRISLDWLNRDGAQAEREGNAADRLGPLVWPGIDLPVSRSAGTIRGERPSIALVPTIDLGPKEYTLTFNVNPRKVNRLVLADPLVYQSGPLAPAVVPAAGDARPMFAEPKGYGTLQVGRALTSRDYVYRQLTAPLSEPDLTPFPVQIDPTYLLNIGERGAPPGLQDWTDQLLQRLVAGRSHPLTMADLERVRIPAPLPDGRTDRLPPDRWEKVARALCTYLASSGEYSYTLELHRQDPSLDAVADFLQNTKQGHCERYASALALMLRTQGIPCRVVKGFRGAESRGDGYYDVRNSHAHSWVEALVERPGPAGKRALHWLSLDPTPANEAGGTATFSWADLWRSGRLWGYEIWKDFIFDYNAEQQGALGQWLAKLWGRGSGPKAWLHSRTGAAVSLVLVLAAVGWVGFRRLRRRENQRAGRAAGHAAADPGYTRLLAILARHCRLRPQPAQTPREFGVTAGEFLRDAGLGVAEVPGQVVALFYRVRFGQQPLDENERHQLDARLDGLDAALRERVALQ